MSWIHAKTSITRKHLHGQSTHLVNIPEFVFYDGREGFQLDGAFLVERLRWEGEVVGLGQSPQVEVIFGVDGRWHVDVELKQLQKLSLQLIPAVEEGKRTGGGLE